MLPHANCVIRHRRRATSATLSNTSALFDHRNFFGDKLRSAKDAAQGTCPSLIGIRLLFSLLP